MLEPKYVRAARALLDWPQRRLALAADIALSTLADYERGTRIPAQETVDRIDRALRQQGIVFIHKGVQLRPDSSSG